MQWPALMTGSRQRQAHWSEGLDGGVLIDADLREGISMGHLYDVSKIHDIRRFPRVQDFASYARLVKCAKESAGKRHGTSGKKIGNVHLKWAFSEAAVLFLRANPEGLKYKQRLERKHGKAKALSILAHKLGRAVYYMLLREKAFDMNKFLAA